MKDINEYDEKDMIPLPHYIWEFCELGFSPCLRCHKFYAGYLEDQHRFIKEEKTVTCDLYPNGVPQDILLNKEPHCPQYVEYFFSKRKSTIEECFALIDSCKTEGSEAWMSEYLIRDTIKETSLYLDYLTEEQLDLYFWFVKKYWKLINYKTLIKILWWRIKRGL